MKRGKVQLHTNGLQPHQEELMDLSELAGIHMSQHVFRILVELLNMQIEPTSIYKLLKRIRKMKRISSASEESTPTA